MDEATMLAADVDTAEQWARLAHAEGIFQLTVDGLVTRVRQAMSVPAHADAEIEAEFSNWRLQLQQFLPEFRVLFGERLIGHLEEGDLETVAAELATPPAQRYLQAAARIEFDLRSSLRKLSERMLVAAQSAIGVEP